MTTIEQQIKAVEKSRALVLNQNRKDLAGCLDDVSQTLVAFNLNEQAAERALKRVKELEEVLEDLVFDKQIYGECTSNTYNKITKLLNP